MLRGRVAFNPLLARSNALCGAIPALHAFRGRAVHLHKLRIVHVAAERAFYRFEVRAMAIRGQLHAIGETRAKVVNEGHRMVTVATANEPRQDQLGVGINGRPCPCVAIGQVLPLRARDVLLLRVGERPDFINLTARVDVLHGRVMEIRASLPNLNKQLRDGIDEHRTRGKPTAWTIRRKALKGLGYVSQTGACL
jgi:hypothetical protein